MSFFTIMSKVAREMDKQRMESIKKKEKEEFNEPMWVSVSDDDIDSFIPYKTNFEFVEGYINELSAVYKVWVEQFLKLEEERATLDLESQFEEYIVNCQDGIALTEFASEEIELVPDVFEVPIHTQQYLEKIKENILLALQCQISRNIVTINGLIETLENGVATENPPELANEFLSKAEFHVKSLNRYIEKAYQSVSY